MNIIEFAGLPGCGKSTVSRQLEENLKKKGYSVKTRKDIMQGVEKGKRLLGNPLLWFNTGRLLLYSLKYKNTDKYDYCIRIVYMNSQLKKIIKGNADEVFILEEGILQDLTAIAYNKPAEQNNYSRLALNILNQIKNHIFYVNCHLPLETDIERIQLRGRRDKKYGGDKDIKELKELLLMKRKNLDFFISKSGIMCLDVNMENEINETADFIEREWMYETNQNVL